jgi:hypothetical protein
MQGTTVLPMHRGLAAMDEPPPSNRQRPCNVRAADDARRTRRHGLFQARWKKRRDPAVSKRR